MDGAFRAGEWLVEPQLNTIASASTTIHLEPKTMKVLVYLAEHAHEVVPKERLIDAVWPGTFVSDAVLTRAISDLRRAFGDDAREPRFILTVPKGGYKLVAPVEPAATAPHPHHGPAVPHPRLGAAAEPASPRSRPRLAAALAILLAAAAGVVYWLTQPLPAPRVGRSLQLTLSGRVSGTAGGFEVFPAVVSDATRLYFSQDGMSTGIRFVSVAGSEVGTIPVPPEICVPGGCTINDISPDGSALLIRSSDTESALWILPTAGGAPRRLGDVEAHAATWFPDGKRILFASGTELFVASGDGTHRRRLLSLPRRAFWLRASPDGQRLRFTVRDPQTSALSLWEVNADGTNLHELLPGWNNPPSECCGNWTPDGSYYLFQSARNEVVGIWALREEPSFLRRGTRGPTQLTAGPFRLQAPVASRDGKTLFAVGTQDRVEPVKYDARSRNFRPFLPGIAQSALRFSRDGQWIADVGRQGMWRMRADGTQRLQLTSPPMYACESLNWSPDGTRIAFQGKLPGRPWKIYLISRDGGRPVQLTSDERNEVDADWSPDGSSVMFGRPPDGMAEAFMPKALHIVDLKTRKVSTVPGSEGIFSPHWSPDGRYIAAMPMKQDKVLLFDFVTGTLVVLANRKAHNPMWSSDSRYVYAQDWSDGAIWRVRINDREIEDVANVKDPRRGLIGFGLTGLAPDGSPVALMIEGSSDIYAFQWDAP